MTQPVELAVPFAVNAAGSIAFTDDLGTMAKNHVFSAVGTNVGERVMNYDYGSHIIEHVFNAITDADMGILQSDIADSVRKNVPEVSLTGVDVSTDESNGTVNVTVRFSLVDNSEQSVTVSTSLPTL